MRRLLAAFALLSFIRLAGQLCRHGMFIDGLVYASIARNLSIGRGTFWQPCLSPTLYPVFYEHPPLLFGLQAGCFRWGESVAVEKLFCAAVFALTAALLLRLVDLLAPARQGPTVVKACAIVPWLFYPETRFVYANNLLEAPMGLFALAATVAYLEQARARGRLARAGWLCGGSLLVAAAVLTKGLPGLFPAAVPFLDRALGERRRAIPGLLAAAAAALLTASLLVGLFAFHPDANAFLHHYWQQQVMASLSGERGADGRGLSLLRVAFFALETVLPSLLLLGGVLALRRGGRAPSPRAPHLRAASVAGAIALSASLPLAASRRISAYYLAPSMVYFAAAFAFLAAALWPVNPATASLSPARWRVLRNGLIAVAAGVAVWLTATWDRPGRDPTCLAVVRAAGGRGLWDRVVDADPALRQDWTLQAYLNRYLRVSLSPASRPSTPYYVASLPRLDPLPAGYEPVYVAGAPAPGYVLLRRIPSPPTTTLLSPPAP